MNNPPNLEQIPVGQTFTVVDGQAVVSPDFPGDEGMVVRLEDEPGNDGAKNEFTEAVNAAFQDRPVSTIPLEVKP